ncbi:unnamed protein product [Ectocarpus sp. 12 AP-2014]
MQGTGIHIILIQPGPITSDLRLKSQGPYEKWMTPKTSARAGEYESKLKPRLYAPASKDTFELPASAVTKVLHKALIHPNPRPRYRITTPTKGMAVAKRLLSTRMLDRILSRA